MVQRYNYSPSKSNREESWEKKADLYGFSISEMVAICSRLESGKSPAQICKNLKLKATQVSVIHQILKDSSILLRNRDLESRAYIRNQRRDKIIYILENFNIKKALRASSNTCVFCDTVFENPLSKAGLRVINEKGEIEPTKFVSCCNLCAKSRQNRTLQQWLSSLLAQKFYNTENYEHYRLQAQKTNLVAIDTLLLRSIRNTRFQFLLGK